MKIKVKVMPAKIRNGPGAIPWQVICDIIIVENEDIIYFVLAFAISELLALPMFVLENLGHGRALQKKNRNDSNLCKSPK